jgi:hypothetical protein
MHRESWPALDGIDVLKAWVNVLRDRLFIGMYTTLHTTAPPESEIWNKLN